MAGAATTTTTSSAESSCSEFTQQYNHVKSGGMNINELRGILYDGIECSQDKQKVIQDNADLDLFKHGVCVIDTHNIHNFPTHEQFKAAIKEFPEYKPDIQDTEARTLGGFGAFNNPSSFHHRTILQIRRSIHEPVKQLLWSYYEQKIKAENECFEQAFNDYVDSAAETEVDNTSDVSTEVDNTSDVSTVEVSDEECEYQEAQEVEEEPIQNIEQIPDRVMWRVASQTISQELWHRDTSPHALQNDVVFGGWVNMDTADTREEQFQEFICVLQSQEEDATGGSGFSRVDKTDHPNLETLQCTIKIPPGHMILFDSTILHNVAQNKGKEVFRQFIGFRLSTPTNDQEPLLNLINKDDDDYINTRIESNGTFCLKSGQKCNMWPASVMNFNHYKIVQFSKLFQDSVKTVRQLLSTGTTSYAINSDTQQKIQKKINVFIQNKYKFSTSGTSEFENIPKDIKNFEDFLRAQGAGEYSFNYTGMLIETPMKSLQHYGLPRYMYSPMDLSILYPHNCRPGNGLIQSNRSYFAVSSSSSVCVHYHHGDPNPRPPKKGRRKLKYTNWLNNLCL